MNISNLDNATLKTILHECRQCGTCCKRYKKVLLHRDEVEFIKKMGGHVGIDATLRQLREKPLSQLVEENKGKGKVYMIHPDDKGCVFLQCRNGLSYCMIYHYRPLSCRGFRCNLADSSFLDLFGGDATCLLGLNSFGLEFGKKVDP
ncbi:MAG: YkgJ family cysteine cluster protein [Proteobacteria bacterium]|nr:YkgJ family cysteine cluster protein [Pseudomonadota bacterium]MBU1649352.1 YkgJ family cysteine cluster protein [Pseudomonadota bacterium]